MTQLTLNAKVSNITKISLYFANHNKEFNIFEEKRRHLSTQLVIERIATLKKIQDNILKMQKKSIKY
jgi:hypothetical protein